DVSPELRDMAGARDVTPELRDTAEERGAADARQEAPGPVPPKPHGSTWTDEQWEAICRSGHNLLVAAAAGSGKTAVLVERIIRKVMDDRKPIDVDRLLVVTFTKAAASEMRERIREALEKALLASPMSAHLRRQLAFV